MGQTLSTAYCCNDDLKRHYMQKDNPNKGLKKIGLMKASRTMKNHDEISATPITANQNIQLSIVLNKSSLNRKNSMVYTQQQRHPTE